METQHRTLTMNYMSLPWKFNVIKKELKCEINEDLWYVAHDGGRSGYTKFFQGDSYEISYNEWTEEKIWLSDNFGEQLGTFSKLTEEEALELTKQLNPKRQSSNVPCFFGITDDGDYLDRNQRPNEVMSNSTHRLMASVPRLEELLYDPSKEYIYETPDGKNLYRREYNTMPCCVFPESPSWEKVDLDDIQKQYPDVDFLELIAQADLSTVDSELLEKYFVLP